jgi:hypothetical protein
MRVWAVVSAETEEAVELFGSRPEAEQMIAEVCEDEPALAEMLRFEAVEVGEESPN